MQVQDCAEKGSHVENVYQGEDVVVVGVVGLTAQVGVLVLLGLDSGVQVLVAFLVRFCEPESVVEHGDGQQGQRQVDVHREVLHQPHRHELSPRCHVGQRIRLPLDIPIDHLKISIPTIRRVLQVVQSRN